MNSNVFELKSSKSLGKGAVPSTNIPIDRSDPKFRASMRKWYRDSKIKIPAWLKESK